MLEAIKGLFRKSEPVFVAPAPVFVVSASVAPPSDPKFDDAMATLLALADSLAEPSEKTATPVKTPYVDDLTQRAHIVMTRTRGATHAEVVAKTLEMMGVSSSNYAYKSWTTNSQKELANRLSQVDPCGTDSDEKSWFVMETLCAIFALQKLWPQDVSCLSKTCVVAMIGIINSASRDELCLERFLEQVSSGHYNGKLALRPLRNLMDDSGVYTRKRWAVGALHDNFRTLFNAGEAIDCRI